MKGAAALLLLALLLVACSDADEGTSPTASPPSPAGETPTVVAEPPATAIATPPTRDVMDLARRLRGLPAGAPRDAPPRGEPLPSGHRQTFQLVALPGPGQARSAPPRTEVIDATLRLVTLHTYLYVQDGVGIEDEALAGAGDRIEEVYTQVRDAFGRERSPGVDGDARITILIASLQNAGGYVALDDGYPRAASPLSNEREMVYLDATSAPVPDGSFARILAHELQHLVHNGSDPDEEIWVQEGLSVVAESMGTEIGFLERAFLREPDVQLNTWDAEGLYEAHYGAAGLFFHYLLQRLGGKADLRDLVSEHGDGVAGVEAFLARRLPGVSFVDLFADWVTANYLDLDEGPYGYPDVSLEAVASESLSAPVQGEGSVHQFAADYIEVNMAAGDAVFTFDGASTVAALATEARGGRGLWWANRGDAIDTTLTRELDLTDLSSATLTFWTWHDIERWYDYGYVEVSTDGGATWRALRGRQTTGDDPLSLAYGPGYTGRSGGDDPRWVEEAIDLTAFAGRRVLLRFEYVTDGGLSTPGWAIDDIAVPELGWHDDAESDGDWESQGFVRLQGPLPQRFIVRVIGIGAETRVTDVALDAGNDAETRLLDFGAGLTKAVIVIAAATEGTSEPATYQYSLTASASSGLP